MDLKTMPARRIALPRSLAAMAPTRRRTASVWRMPFLSSTDAGPRVPNDLAAIP